MAPAKASPLGIERSELWDLVRSQHGVLTRMQLLAFGLEPGAITHRLRSGRPAAVLSHRSAAALHGISDPPAAPIQVTVPPDTIRTRPGVHAYRRVVSPDEVATVERIPVTTVERTLLDLAPVIGGKRLEAAINAADKYDLIDPESLRSALERYAGRRGVTVLRQMLDRRTFTLTDSELERRFLPLARAAGLGQPRTGGQLNGFKVDFYWPGLGLVVETDGLRYHRTPAAQARDRLRDQAHTVAGLTALRFTHAQVRYEPRHVRKTLAAVAHQLRAPRPR